MDEPRSQGPPPWAEALVRMAARRLLSALVGAALIVLVVVALAGRLQALMTILVMALFLSFAIEPAVNWLHARGWRRGTATGLIFVAVIAVFALLFALIVPAVINGFRQLIGAAPDMIDHLQRYAAKFGIDFSSKKLLDEVRKNATHITSSAAAITSGVLGLGASILGQVFRWATIGLFLFYMVAEGPKLREAICRRLPPARQQEVLFVWEQAIEKTGGYFYSRILLAVINGTGMYITLRLLKVPFAAPLALFEGLIAEFIPVVGTYFAGAAPLLIALLFSPPDALWVLAYILVYQQLENYVLSPRLTAKTMALHPAVAFAAALTGGALGGVLMAFLALPAAAVIQSAVQQYGKAYQIVESDLTAEPAPHVAPSRRSLRDRLRRRNSPKERPAG